MRFVIIEVDRLAELGIDTTTNIKSRDGSLVLIHETILQQADIDTTVLQGYEHNSEELKALLSSPEWATVDPATETEVI